MQGYSFRSLTDLVLKIFKTKITAGTGLSGGGSLETDRTLNVTYGTTAGTATQGDDTRVVNAASNAIVNAKEAALEAKKADKVVTITAGTGLTGGGTLADNRTLTVKYGTTAGTAAQGNDSRLSDPREWKEETIGQAEAEAGVEITRRAFTAQRVRQAIIAWFNSISGALGRTILARTTAAQVRSDIGLGTAATYNVGTSSGDVMEVGAFGLGFAEKAADFATRIDSGFYLSTDGSVGMPSGMVSDGGWMINLNWHSNNAGNRYNCSFYGNVQNNFIGFRRINNLGEPQAPVELHHTGNLLQTTGSSSAFPMSQQATTIALNTKATLSHTHPWNQVTDQPATATRWPTFAEITDKPATFTPSAHTHTWTQVTSIPIVQAVGTSTTSFMSQKAVTDAINNNSIGVGQTWQDMSSSRVLATTYTNTTGRSIQLDLSFLRDSSWTFSFTIDGISGDNGGGYNPIIPHGSTYKVDANGVSGLVWRELR